MKERLIGALVVVSLAVIFLPMLFSGRDELLDKGSVIPPMPAVSPVPAMAPLESAAPGEPATGIERNVVVSADEGGAAPLEGEAAEGQPASTPAPAQLAAVPAVTTTPAAPPAAESLTPQAAALAGKATTRAAAAAWVVQVGSFSTRDKALGVRDRLRQQKFPAFLEELVEGKVRVYRVRIGPVPERAAADALRDRVIKDAQLQAVVMPHR